MRTFSRFISSTGLAIVASLHFGAMGSFAFDASKILKGDETSNQFIHSFQQFKQRGQEDEALQMLEYAARNGNPAAQWKLGRMYQTGDGVPHNEWEAFRFFQKLTENYRFLHPRSMDWQFSANAFVALGNYYKNGISDGILAPDPRQARVMYTTAAMFFRHPEGQFELGKMDLEKARTRRAARRALRLLQKATTNGHVGAKALIGREIFYGEHVKRNAVKGLVLLTEAREEAGPKYFDWVTGLHEEAMSLATVEERNKAISQIQKKR